VSGGLISTGGHPILPLLRNGAFLAAIAKSLAIASGPLRGPALVTLPLTGEGFAA
jgi:hypothetical protein